MYTDILVFLKRWIPEYVNVNRSYLTVAIGCTGGTSDCFLLGFFAWVSSGSSSPRRNRAPPVSCMVGLPLRMLMTPRSRQNTPRRNPVPSAFEQASLAAQRRA